MSPAELKNRTRAFTLSVIRLVDEIPRDRVADHLARQLLRAGSSVGANYRAACRARSSSEMQAKLGIVEEEADECLFWLDALVDSGRLQAAQVQAVAQEADEILRITVSSIKTLKNSTGAGHRVREFLKEDYGAPHEEEHQELPDPVENVGQASTLPSISQSAIRNPQSQIFP